MRRLCEAHPDIACRDGSDPDSVAHALRELAEHGVNAVAISGGDGTVNAVLNAVFAHNPFPRLPLLRPVARWHRQHDRPATSACRDGRTVRSAR